MFGSYVSVMISNFLQFTEDVLFEEIKNFYPKRALPTVCLSVRTKGFEIMTSKYCYGARYKRIVSSPAMRTKGVRTGSRTATRL